MNAIYRKTRGADNRNARDDRHSFGHRLVCRSDTVVALVNENTPNAFRLI